MSSPYVGEIRIFAGNFAPAGWAFCDGTTIPISENDTLFNLIGTTYGGDGQETFNLPDLRGRVPIHRGTNPATGTTYLIGESSGVESVTLTVQQIPSHTHPLLASGDAATGASPVGNVPGAGTTISLYRAQAPTSAMAPEAVLPAGGNQPHDNMQPFLGVNFIISLFGVFPSQN